MILQGFSRYVVLPMLVGLALSSAGLGAPLEDLIKASQSGDETARLTAIDALGTLGAPAVPTLLESLRSKSAAVRAHAARSLGLVGEPAKTAAQSLIAALGDPEQSVRREAVRALAAIRPGPQVTVPLFVKLMHDADPGVRMRVMEAVAEAKGASVPALIELLKNPQGDYWACVILRDIGPEAAAAAPAVAAKLSDKRPEIRREAALALAAMGAVDTAPQIARLLSDTHTQTAAAYALGALGKVPAEAEKQLKALVESDDKLLSITSHFALARVHPQDKLIKRAAIARFVEGLKDSDPYVRAAAARAISALPPSPEITGPLFEKALSSADEQTTHHMLDALASLGPAAVPRLIKALDHATLRPQVAHILGQIGPAAAPATNALAGLVNDPDPNVAIEAAHALARIGPGAKDGVPALIEGLKHPEGKRGYAAAYALGKIGAPAAVAEPALMEVVHAKQDSLSLLCAWAVLQIRGASAETAAKVLPDLVAGLSLPAAKSRESAAEILASLGPLAKSAAPALEKLSKDADPQVRAAAAKALQAIRG